MSDRRTLAIYGLKVFALFWGLAELAGYVNRGPNASAEVLVRGALISALIAGGFAAVAVFARKYAGDDAAT